MFGRLAVLQHQLLAVALQDQSHGTALRVHRPVAPGHRADEVDLERIAQRLRADHELVAAMRQIEHGQVGAALGARAGLGGGQRVGVLGIGPRLVGRAPLHAQDRRVHRRQAPLGVVGAGVGLQQRERGQHGVVLHHLLAHEPVRNARVGLEVLLEPGQLGAREPHGAGGREHHPSQPPTAPRTQPLCHGADCARRRRASPLGRKCRPRHG